MSTRCCVKVVKHFENKTAEVMIYHHHDGYPEGVGVDLVKRSKKWKGPFQDRKEWDIDDVVNSLIKDQTDEYEYTAYNHCDIEFLYTIDCDTMTIKCNECNMIFEDENGNRVWENEVGAEVQIPVVEEKQYEKK